MKKTLAMRLAVVGVGVVIATPAFARPVVKTKFTAESAQAFWVVPIDDDCSDQVSVSVFASKEVVWDRDAHTVQENLLGPEFSYAVSRSGECLNHLAIFNVAAETTSLAPPNNYEFNGLRKAQMDANGILAADTLTSLVADLHVNWTARGAEKTKGVSCFVQEDPDTNTCLKTRTTFVTRPATLRGSVTGTLTAPAGTEAVDYTPGLGMSDPDLINLTRIKETTVSKIETHGNGGCVCPPQE